MLDLSELLAADAVDGAMNAPSKKVLFKQLASVAERRTGLPGAHIANCLAARERLGSTGFGGGIAIPHGKIEGLPAVWGFFARLTNPIDYESVDGLPVDLVFLLLSPPDAGADHLKALAAVSRTLRDRATVAKLRGARSTDAIFALLTGGESAHAA